jgi:hypothetical protein
MAFLNVLRGFLPPTAILCCFLLLMPGKARADQPRPLLFDFETRSDAQKWVSVNDNVMGGRSEGALRVQQEGMLEFSGNLSLAVWPQWRGPSRDGLIATGTPWPDRIDAATLKPSWRVVLGPSYSGPIVAADRVFVTETENATNEVVRALDRRTGAKLWQASWKGSMRVPFFAMSNGSWIRATPAYDGESLFVAGMRDVLVSLNAASGKVQWRVDFVSDFKKSMPVFGLVSAPLVQGDFLYVQVGGAVRKLDKHSGDLVWLLDERKVSSDSTWAHLAVCDREIFIRELGAMTAYRWGSAE